jgi:hypothetical protein
VNRRGRPCTAVPHLSVRPLLATEQKLSINFCIEHDETEAYPSVQFSIYLYLIIKELRFLPKSFVNAFFWTVLPSHQIT